MNPDRPVRQIAYFVRDAETAARRHTAAFGSGPFYLAEHIPLSACRYRGEPGEMDHTSAYGQWGEVMVEFVQQNDTHPSAFHDMFPGGEEGLHHLALFVDDLAAEMAQKKASGVAEAFYGETSPGVGFAFMDTRPLYGHVLELYAPTKPLLVFYARVREISGGRDQGDLIRLIRFRQD